MIYFPVLADKEHHHRNKKHNNRQVSVSTLFYNFHIRKKTGRNQSAWLPF